MVTIVRTRTIAAPADAVFAVLADFPSVSRYHPHVVSATQTSDARTGVGAARRCSFDAEGESYLDEVIIAFDAAARRYRVDITAGTARPPARRIEAELAVIPLTSGSSRVDFTMQLDGNVFHRLLAKAVIARKFGTVMDEILAGLDHHVRTGREVSTLADLSA